MGYENPNEWEPFVPDEMGEKRDFIQNKFRELADKSDSGPWMKYSIVLDEFNYRTQKIELEDIESVSELVREYIPFIATAASVIESQSKTILIFYFIKEDKIYDDDAYHLFDSHLTQGERGQLLDKLDLLPRHLSEDMVKFNRLRNVIVHEYQSHYSLEESRFDEDEFGDALLAGVRSVQGLSEVMDMVVPDVAFE
jgi:hypothetical protein